MKQLCQILAGLLLIAGLSAGGWWLIAEVIESLSDLDKLVQAALITVAGAALTAIAAFLVKKIEKKNEVEAQFREQKVQLFNDLLLQFSLLSEEGGKRDPEELVQFLRDFQRKLIFWGGPKVLTSFIAIRRGFTESKTIGDLGGALQILGDLILAMRKDLGLSNSNTSDRIQAAISAIVP